MMFKKKKHVYNESTIGKETNTPELLRPYVAPVLILLSDNTNIQGGNNLNNPENTGGLFNNS